MKVFPFKLGLLDQKEHPTDILFLNYLFSIVSIATIVYFILWVFRKIVSSIEEKLIMAY
jgi:hypothetical protein